jgi:hypothetical protein
MEDLLQEQLEIASVIVQPDTSVIIVNMLLNAPLLQMDFLVETVEQ